MIIYQLFNTQTNKYEKSGSQSIWLNRSHIINILHTSERFKNLPNWDHLIIEKSEAKLLSADYSEWFRKEYIMLNTYINIKSDLPFPISNRGKVIISKPLLLEITYLRLLGTVNSVIVTYPTIYVKDYPQVFTVNDFHCIKQFGNRLYGERLYNVSINNIECVYNSLFYDSFTWSDIVKENA